MVSRLTALTVVVLAVLVPPALSGQAQGAEVRVYGSIADVETGRPLDGVTVQLRSDSLSEDADRFTNDRGRFAFDPLPPGIYRLRIVRLGYETVEHTIQLTPRTEVELEVELSSSAVALEPIIVETTRRSPLQVTGFYDRRDRGLGRFVTRDDIESRNAFFVSDLLVTMPGVRVSSSGRPGGGGVVTMRGGCRPSVFLDGVRMLQPFALDDFLGVQDIEAMEVYSGAQTPAQYSTTGCGTIVVWTRRPSASGRPFSWRRLAAGVGFLAAGFLLTR